MGSFHSAPGTKAEEKVFLLYFKADSSKIKQAKILTPAAVPPAKPAQAGEGHEAFHSQKASLRQAQIQIVLKLSSLGGCIY